MLAEEKKQQIALLVKKVYENPELSGEEFFACAEQIGFLKREGFEVVSPIAGEKTAYRAEYSVHAGGTEKLPAFAFCSEYDALPKVRHGCGHHLIMGGAITAALCLRKLLEEKNIPGKIVLFGCPAEETYGGKLKIADSGAADDIDAFLMAHSGGGLLALGGLGYAGMKRVKVTFSGSGGSGVPRLADPSFVNPLDASTLLYQAVAMRRHFFPANVNIAGVIVNGGERSNILPVASVSDYTIRSQDPLLIDKYAEIFRKMAEGAAMLTGTELELSEERTWPPTLPNLVLSESFLDSMEKRGRKVKRILPIAGFLGTTDFGIFSRKAPGCHVHFPIMADPCAAHHTEEYNTCSGTSAALECMFDAGESMAETAFRFFSDETFRASVKKAFTQEPVYQVQ